MSDHNHASSVQGSNKNIENDYGWKEKVRLLRTKLEKIEKIQIKNVTYV